jgi:hypothetical protein
MGYLESVLNSLPPVVENRHSGMYGCRGILAKYCGFTNIPWQGYLDPQGSNWQHGWHPPAHNVHPEIIVGTDGKSSEFKQTKRFFVAREDQRIALDSFGYRWVTAIGMPILYVERPILQRIPKSLLVMPSHSLDDTKHSWDFSQFSQSLSQIIPEYDFVAACIHPACIRKGFWLKEFESLGIPVIEGAVNGDQNALYRMANLLSSFTDVVGNGFGSHLVYANCFGANVFLLPPWPKNTEEDFKSSGFYKNNPDAIRLILQLTAEESVRQSYPFLFTRGGPADRSWGKTQLGSSHVQTPPKIKRLVGWDLLTRIRFGFMARVRKFNASS